MTALVDAIDRWIERTFFGGPIDYRRRPDVATDSRWPGRSPRGGRASGTTNHSP